MIGYAENHNNCAAARHFGISESNVRLWKKNLEKFQAMPVDKHANCGKQAWYPVLEKDLV